MKTKHLTRLLLIAAGLAAALPPLLAQTPDTKPPSFDEEQLEFGSISFYSENDKYFAGTDQHYTNGFKLSFLTTDLRNFTSEPVPAPVRAAARALGRLTVPDAAYKLNLSLGQNIYTPVDTKTTAYQPDDRPYAAWLYVGAAYQNYLPERVTAGGFHVPERLDVFEITVGTVGPSALGRQVQNRVHEIIDVPQAEGWANQIHNEFGLNLIVERKYRFSTAGARTGWGADFIPHGGFSVGNIFTYANLGAEVRIGWRLPTDFGTNLIRPSGDSNSAVRPRWSVFAFGAVDGRAVARDITLDGNTFRDSPSIKSETLVGDFQTGLALGTRHFQLTYSQAVRTKEFKTQQRHSVFGSLSATFYF